MSLQIFDGGMDAGNGGADRVAGGTALPGAGRSGAIRSNAMRADATRGETPAQRKLRQAAGQFESILLSTLWKSMKSSFEDDDTEFSDPAHGTLDDWGIEAMSSAVGKAGGLGIAKLILKHLEPKLGGATVLKGGVAG